MATRVARHGWRAGKRTETGEGVAARRTAAGRRGATLAPAGVAPLWHDPTRIGVGEACQALFGVGARARAGRYGADMARSRLDDLWLFYSHLHSLESRVAGPRQLSDCSGRMQWPARGVYFFRESSEARTDTGEGPRIVRVGTHALKATSGTTLWNRLSQHKGQARSRGGNHRGSIFRLLVGTALIGRDGHRCPSWGQCSSAPREVREREQPLENAVSTVIGAMPVLWLAIDDEPGPDSLRGYIERNAIALLSNFGRDSIDLPSPSWLGHHCNRVRVRESGLWNSRHVEEPYDPQFLDTLARLIDEMEMPT